MKLFEGGDETVTSKKGIKTKAQKIPLKKIGRSRFRKVVTDLLKKINNDFKKKFKTLLWADETQIETGITFNGSSSFIMDPNIPDEEIVKYKEVAGDIDVVVPDFQRKNIWDYLESIDSKEVIPGVTYMGCNRAKFSPIENQIICVFVADFDGLKVPMQLDLEFLPFSETGLPSEWAKFSHSSSLEDTKAGIKAVHHKYLLRALVYGVSVRDDIVICTTKSTYDNYTISKSKNLVNPGMMKFSVGKGLRVAFEPLQDPEGNPVFDNGKQVFKEIPVKDSDYVTDVAEILKLSINPSDAECLESDSKKFWSFTGLVELIKTYVPKENWETINQKYVKMLWELKPRSQELERSNPELDYKVKISGYKFFIDSLGLSDLSKDLINPYYDEYRITESKPSGFRSYLKSKGFI
jgi:hypothetical protein